VRSQGLGEEPIQIYVTVGGTFTYIGNTTTIQNLNNGDIGIINDGGTVIRQ
jgi:hypothetical protein